MADAFDFTGLASASSSLYILEMNFRVFPEIDNRAEIVIETYKKL
jgi:hypothetical protein